MCGRDEEEFSFQLIADSLISQLSKKKLETILYGSIEIREIPIAFAGSLWISLILP